MRAVIANLPGFADPEIARETLPEDGLQAASAPDAFHEDRFKDQWVVQLHDWSSKCLGGLTNGATFFVGRASISASNKDHPGPRDTTPFYHYTKSVRIGPFQ